MPHVGGHEDIGDEGRFSDSRLAAERNAGASDANTRAGRARKQINDLIQQLIGNVGTQSEKFFSGADELLGRSQGGFDPRLSAFRDRRLGAIRGQNAEHFGRRGTGGSTAALNALQRSTGEFDDQFGLTELDRQDEQFNQSFGLRTAGLETQQLSPAILLQLMAELRKQGAV